MTQEEIDNGRLVILVGFAPHGPGEFVVIRDRLGAADHRPVSVPGR
jgi:hypothetical protein